MQSIFLKSVCHSIHFKEWWQYSFYLTAILMCLTHGLESRRDFAQSTHTNTRRDTYTYTYQTIDSSVLKVIGQISVICLEVRQQNKRDFSLQLKFISFVLFVGKLEFYSFWCQSSIQKKEGENTKCRTVKWNIAHHCMRSISRFVFFFLLFVFFFFFYFSFFFALAMKQ